jgi:hypothetical protein
VEKYRVTIKRSAVKEIEAIPQKKSGREQFVVLANWRMIHDQLAQKSCLGMIDIEYVKVTSALFTVLLTRNLPSRL